MSKITRSGRKVRDFDFEFQSAQVWRDFAKENKGKATANDAQGSTLQGSAEQGAGQPPVTPPHVRARLAAQEAQAIVAQASVPEPAQRIVYVPGGYQTDYSRRNYAIPNVLNIIRAQENELTPEGVVFINEAHQRQKAGEPPDGKAFWIVKLYANFRTSANNHLKERTIFPSSFLTASRATFMGSE